SGPVLNTHSVKAGFTPGEKLRVKVTYTCIVNMVRDRDIVESKAHYEKEGDSYIDAAAKKIIEEYKANAEKGTIKLNRVDVGTSIEIVNLDIHSNKRTALFRRIAHFDVG